MRKGLWKTSCHYEPSPESDRSPPMPFRPAWSDHVGACRDERKGVAAGGVRGIHSPPRLVTHSGITPRRTPTPLSRDGSPRRCTRDLAVSFLAAHRQPAGLSVAFFSRVRYCGMSEAGAHLAEAVARKHSVRLLSSMDPWRVSAKRNARCPLERVGLLPMAAAHGWQTAMDRFRKGSSVLESRL